MTDPLEDRLRSHLADQAARVTATPDPSAFVERSTGRDRFGAPLVAGAAAVVALLVGGSFATGWSVAASSPTTTTTPGTSRAAAPLAHPTALSPGAAGVDISGSGAAVTDPLTALFTRTTGSDVTIRTYTSTAAGGGCSTPAACPPIASVPVPVQCPKGAMCAQPVTTPIASTPATPGGAPGSSPGSSAGSSPGSSGGSTGGTATGTGGGTTTVPVVAGGCQQLTLELSTAAAVGTATLAAPTNAALGPKTVELVGTGSFGGAEGDPVGWVAVVASGDVASVRLESSTGAVLDAMVPSSGMAVLAATGGSGLVGTSVVGVDPGGAVLATVAVGAAPSGVGPGCTSVPPGPPVTTPPTTTPVPTTTTTTSTTTPSSTDPTSSTVVPPTAVPNVVPSQGPPTGSG
jgi:hypothetical protein